MWREVGIFTVVVVFGVMLFLVSSFAWRMIRVALGKKDKSPRP